MKKFVILLILSLFLLGCGSSEPAKPSVQVGGNAIIAVDSFSGTTEENETELIRYANAKNEDAIRRMLTDGRAFLVDKGDKVTVIERGPMKTKIEMLSGPYKGSRGYIASEHVKAE
ncbi:hypothetical protein [Sporomusa sp. KB1]|uniref:hypothetical protein n=1 Tax=Sporomusa sp. KB1 TaxID=943346 RepID=UPI0011A7D6A8|nr:hypothetical protein [Sporomusa sp. KB1]TWH45895.1 hypothetical protein Salpa_1827 [Sporomusa sp. KB1]